MKLELKPKKKMPFMRKPSSISPTMEKIGEIVGKGKKKNVKENY